VKDIDYFTELNLPKYDLHNALKEMLIKEEIWWTMDQICLNVPKNIKAVLNVDGKAVDNPYGPDTEDFMFGVGSLDKDWTKAEKILKKEKDGTMTVASVSAPKNPNPLNEMDFDTLCGVFKDTIFEEVYNLLKSKFNVGRTRLMMSQPRRCMSWHYDWYDRIHYPIKTQTGCLMVIEDEVKHLEQDQWYLTKTTSMHTAINGSDETRIHLVACV